MSSTLLYMFGPSMAYKDTLREYFKFDLTGVQTNDLQIMDSRPSFYVPETSVSTTELSLTALLYVHTDM